MSTMLPRSRAGVFVVGLLLVDLPVLLAVAVLGFWLGFAHTLEAITRYRMEHPWTFAPSVALAVVLVVRWRRAR